MGKIVSFNGPECKRGITPVGGGGTRRERGAAAEM
jgi:hypothetical protein